MPNVEEPIAEPVAPRIHCTEWPARLFRCFNEGAHAEEFLQGRIRFGRLDAYTTIEDESRRDGTEGRAVVREWRGDRLAARVSAGGNSAELVSSPGEVTRHTEFGNAVFLCCCTAPPDDAWDRIRGQFGAHVVEIADPRAFCNDLGFALPTGDAWLDKALLMLLPAEYTKGELVPRERDPLDRAIELAIAQKPPNLAYQHEYRLALISNEPTPSLADRTHPQPPEHVYVDIGHRLEYARLVGGSP